MVTIETIAHIGDDGILHVEVPNELKNRDVSVRVSLNTPQRFGSGFVSSDTHSWIEFLDRTAGSIPDEEFRRWPQGEFELRDALD